MFPRFFLQFGLGALDMSAQVVRRWRLDRALSDLSLLAVHELDSLGGHWAALRERLVVARKARGVGELLSDQLDLLPETQARLRRDHAIRRELLRGVIDNWRAAEADSVRPQ